MNAFLHSAIQQSLQWHVYPNAIFLSERLFANTRSLENLYTLANSHFIAGNHKRTYQLLKDQYTFWNQKQNQPQPQQPQQQPNYFQSLLRYLYGVCCVKLQKYNEAEKVLRLLIKSCPPVRQVASAPTGFFVYDLLAMAYYWMGTIFRYTNRRTQAIEHLKISLELNPMLWCALESICQMGGEVDTASIYNGRKASTVMNNALCYAGGSNGSILSSFPRAKDNTQNHSDDTVLGSNNIIYNNNDNVTMMDIHTDNNINIIATATPASNQTPNILSSDSSNFRLPTPHTPNIGIANNIHKSAATIASNNNSNTVGSTLLSESTKFFSPIPLTLDSTGTVTPTTSISKRQTPASTSSVFTPHTPQQQLQKQQLPPPLKLTIPGVSDVMTPAGFSLASPATPDTVITSDASFLPHQPAPIKPKKKVGVPQANKQPNNKRNKTSSRLFGSATKEPIPPAIMMSSSTATPPATHSNGVFAQPQPMALDHRTAADELSVPIPAFNAFGISDALQRNQQFSIAHVEAALQLLNTLAEGLKLFVQFKCREAVQKFSTLSVGQYETGWVLSHVGRAYFEMANYQQAEKTFERLLQVESSRLEGLEVYSTILWHLKKEKQLSYLANHMSEVDRLSPCTLCVIGNCFSLQKDHGTALKFFQRASQVDNLFTYSYTLAGHEHFANDDLDEALQCYRNAIRIDCRHYNAWYGLGSVYFRQEKYDLAEYHFRRALQINPRSSILYCNLGMALTANHKYPEALEMLRRAINIHPRNPMAKFKLANVLILQKEYDLALKELKELTEMAPKEATVYLTMGRIYKKLGKMTEALQNFNMALDLDPKENQNIKTAIEKLYSAEEDDDEEEEEDGEDDKVEQEEDVDEEDATF